MGWAINLPHGSEVEFSKGAVSFRDHTGTLLRYRPRFLSAWVMGQITTKGRRLEARA